MANTGGRIRTVFTTTISAVCAMLMAACDVHEWPDTPPDTPPEAARVELRLEYETGDMPLHTTVHHTPGSRAGAGHDFRYRVCVYPLADDSRYPGSRSPHSEFTATATPSARPDTTFVLDLPPGRYSIVAWSDYTDRGSAADKFYDSSDFSRITLMQQQGSHPGNLEEREAFRGAAELTVDAADLSAGRTVRATAAMTRPIARFRFVATDVQDFLARGEHAAAGSKGPPAQAPAVLSDYSTHIIYTGYMPHVYNALTDKPTDSRTGQSFAGTIKQPEADGSEAELGFDYVFVNGSEASVQLALRLNRRDTGEMLSQTATINVPLKRGRLTEIRGRFLTATATGGVGINPDFDGDYNIEIK